MNHHVNIHRPLQMNKSDLNAMFKLRYSVFHDRLGWDVQTKDGMERDEFDDLPEVSYVLAKDADGSVDACWRLLPTTGPYMLRLTFPELLHGQAAPMSEDCWELSRFAVATDRVGTSNATFGPMSMALMRQSAEFALENNITRYVSVTTPVMERMLRQQGLHVHRIGPSIRIGVASAVAVVIEVDDITLAAIKIRPPQ
ncbi:acyl homoserine lactone synthase [Hydrogenophaga palleronii]|uniref:Acyl-homoserine-lactone synthase n=1 Tax=Hydrogenophaga palleronii TaxID=65655 RepID=A0ABU1WS09_9BURK|nr:acyl-homoserine-lactone synthase [Hydrogenophaga palleronii]MDR7152053.1 acyl homoserine lactone synthase [Hydrogenophaga palleronii]